MDYNWLSPKAQARPAGEKGWGSYVVEPIQAGETVAAFGGSVVPMSVLQTFSDDRQSRSIQVDTDLYLVSGETPDAGDMLNHSCEPNCGLLGQMLVVAMRDIEPGEELSFDYKLDVNASTEAKKRYACRCGAPNCRGTMLALPKK